MGGWGDVRCRCRWPWSDVEPEVRNWGVGLWRGNCSTWQGRTVVSRLGVMVGDECHLPYAKALQEARLTRLSESSIKGRVTTCRCSVGYPACPILQSAKSSRILHPGEKKLFACLPPILSSAISNWTTNNSYNSIMSSFFTVPNSLKKRKRTEAVTSGGKPKKHRENYLQEKPAGKKGRPTDEDISSESEGESDGGGKAKATDDEEDEEDEEFEGETAAEKRLRLAQQYLDNLKEDASMYWNFSGFCVNSSMLISGNL